MSLLGNQGHHNPLRRTIARVRAWINRHYWPSFTVATLALIVLVHFTVVLFVPPSREKTWKEIHVTKGMSFKAIAEELQREGIIRYGGYFKLLGKIEGISRRVRAGYYGLNTNMNMWTVLDALREGKIIEYEVVIPEGYNLYQIGWTLSQTPLLQDHKDFDRLVTNKEFVHSLGINANTLEGYLFPDTYFFPKGITLKEIAQQMVQRFNAVFVDSYRQRAADLGFTERQIVTLASIIEKEAKVESERRLIAAVYYNRLKRGMKLQSDPTAVYGLRAWVTKVTAQDLRRRSPYNTYLHRGLPPGPIANPGRGSLLAALYPADVDYLYFVAQGDGRHFFSKDYRSHEMAVNRYRRELREERRAARRHRRP